MQRHRRGQTRRSVPRARETPRRLMPRAPMELQNPRRERLCSSTCTELCALIGGSLCAACGSPGSSPRTARFLWVPPVLTLASPPRLVSASSAAERHGGLLRNETLRLSPGGRPDSSWAGAPRASPCERRPEANRSPVARLRLRVGPSGGLAPTRCMLRRCRCCSGCTRGGAMVSFGRRAKSDHDLSLLLG